MSNAAIRETTLNGQPPTTRGKVRDIYDLGDRLVLVATDRISAFDWVNPIGIPGKGKLLTQLSLFWFEMMGDIVKNHLISADLADFPEEFQATPEIFEGRSMLVRKCAMFPVEFVVRGYLAGSGWKEYRQQGTVCGIKLPEGLVEASQLPEPIYTPATKATDGHDINIPPEEAGKIIGEELNEKASGMAKAIYARGRDYAAARGIILCDTKFEFGMLDGEIVLADEILTPDSSRFWPADQYQPGSNPPSYDKQFVRDYLETTDWDKKLAAAGAARGRHRENPREVSRSLHETHGKRGHLTGMEPEHFGAPAGALPPHPLRIKDREYADSTRDECGLCGVFDHPEAATLIYLGLYALQHRGQEGTGIACASADALTVHRGIGLVSDVFRPHKLARVHGRHGIGHVRYSTFGSSTLKNVQPLVVDYARGSMALAHNGNLVNAAALREELEGEGAIFQSTTDSEVVIHLIARSKKSNFTDCVVDALEKVTGAYSLLAMNERKIVAVRDPHGIPAAVAGASR